MNLGKHADYIAAAVIAISFILYANIALNSPIVFGDEGYYGTTARWIAKNLIMPEYTPLIGTNIYHDRFSTSKPVFFLYEAFGYFFGGEMLVKLLIVLPAAVAAALIYLFGKKRFGWVAGLVAASTFLLVPSFVTYGVLGYTDSLFIVFVLASIHFGISALENKRKSHMLVAAAFIGLATLTKNSAIFLFLFLFLYEMFVNSFKSRKYLLAMFVLAALLSAPWLARNQILFGNMCYFFPSDECGPKYDVEVPKVQELKFEGRTSEVGTEVGLFKFGLLNYARFAYGWALPILFFFGLAVVLTRRGINDKILLLLFASILPLIMFSTWRAEDTARYMLPLNIPMALISGIFVSEIYNTSSRKHIVIGVAVLIIALGFAWIYGSEKISTMMQVKQFVPGVIEGCKWVRENTPENSILFATYAAQVRHQCERTLGVAGAEEVMLGNESISYGQMKLNGINYVFVINGLIVSRNLTENYPEQFVRMMENSTKFKKVYDNGDRFGSASVRVFEVL